MTAPPGSPTDRALTADDWRALFAVVPRELFLPGLVWQHDMATGVSVAVDRDADPDGWLAAARGNDPIVTQWDDGDHHGPGPGTLPTSSASMPSVVAAMLEAAALTPGIRVLEIGTGTGWTAGLMARRLGEHAVTSVEVDPEVARLAGASLHAAGLRPRLVVGDGLGGAPDGAPYDRLVSTVGVRQLPSAWLGQVRAGGLIVTPWGTHYSNGDALAVLTVNEDGTASGRFARPLEFMKVRSQRLAFPDFGPGLGPVADSETDDVPPDHGPRRPFTFAAGLLLPGVTHAVQPLESGGRTLWLYALDGTAWASATRAADATVTRVRQVGGRRLWDELAGAHAWWRAAGEPGSTRFGITVGPDTFTPWLDSPDHRVPAG
ncbi:methyltransferase domain-containing protein [Streptomyces otsuchiensis]|uniref:methyltransferase domain-containing protein n=1 Tax=Streptomyces otsuchiensis TaxID=2681388 RepID=UPI001030E18A|nr:methyltransferase domain-containing protein [Streptomyces otsuchiensis]